MRAHATLTRLAAVAFLAAGCATRGPARREIPPFDLRLPFPELGTGSELLVASVEFPRASYQVGDRIEGRCRLTNVSDGPVSFCNQDLGIAPTAHRARVFGPDGREIACPKGWGSIEGFMYQWFEPDMVVTLGPGESHEWSGLIYWRSVEDGVLLGEGGFDVSTPGTYEVWFEFASQGGKYEYKYPPRRVPDEGAPERSPELVACHVLSEPVRLEILPGVPGNALAKSKEPDPAETFGKRYVPPCRKSVSALPEEVFRRLDRYVSFESEPEDTAGEVVGFLNSLTECVDIDPALSARVLGTRIHVADMMLGDTLYWLARLTGTSLVLRAGAVTFTDGPREGDVALAKGDLPRDEQWAKDLVSRIDREMSCEFAGTPLREAVDFLRSLAKMNIIVDPEIRGGKVTREFTNVALKDVLHEIVEAAGCDYEVNAGAIYVFPLKTGKRGTE